MLRKILFLCFLGLFAFAESFEDIKDLEFASKKNLKILILNEDMQIREVVDINNKAKDNITLKLDKNEKFYITIIQKDSDIPKTHNTEKKSEKLVQSLKITKKTILTASSTESKPEFEEKSIYE